MKLFLPGVKWENLIWTEHVAEEGGARRIFHPCQRGREVSFPVVAVWKNMHEKPPQGHP